MRHHVYVYFFTQTHTHLKLLQIIRSNTMNGLTFIKDNCFIGLICTGDTP